MFLSGADSGALISADNRTRERGDFDRGVHHEFDGERPETRRRNRRITHQSKDRAKDHRRITPKILEAGSGAEDASRKDKRIENK